MFIGTSPACRAGEIRLVGSGTTTQGRVEVCGDNREWGKVCDNSWTTLDAQVACKQLGFSSDGICTCIILIRFLRTSLTRHDEP